MSDQDGFQRSPAAGQHRRPDFQMLFEAVPGLHLVLSPKLEIVAVSDAYAAATMTRREEIVGRGIFDVFPDNPDDPDATGVSNLQASLDAVRNHRVADTMAVQQYDIREPDGTFIVRHWSPRNAPVLDANGDLAYIIHTVEDVTEFLALRESRDAQEREVLARSAELATINRELRAANAAKDQFLSRVSHELRTPLTAIAGFAELLTGAKLRAEHSGWADMILRASEHLSDLVDEVLDLSNLAAGGAAIERTPIAVETAIGDALRLVDTQAQTAQITIHTTPLAERARWVSADARRLQQILLNLLTNAIKYNQPGGTVTVAALDDGERGVVIEVSDTGRGLSPDAVERLFVPFERLDAAQSGVEGIGLGLALSRTLAEAMGGAIGVRSTPGAGSTFWVRLHAAEPEPAAPAPPPSPNGEVAYGAPRKLLYIEDTVVNVKLVEAILKRRPSVEVLAAYHGQTGLDAAREHRPDLILLDLHLPDMSGHEVLAQLRADPCTSDIPVMILSATVAEAERRPLLEAGASRYLTKPIAMAELLAAVDELIGVDLAAS